MKNLRPLFIAIAAFAGFAISSPVGAQTTQTWQGTGADWNTGADWSSGVPGPLDTALFNSTGINQLNVTLSAAGTAQNIEFNTGAGAYVIGTPTGPAITLTDGGSIYSNFGNGVPTETINAPLILGTTGSSSTFNFSDNDSSDVLNFGGTITGAASFGNTETLNFNNMTGTVTGAISDGANGGQVAITTGNNGLNLTLAGANTYTGSTQIYNNSTITVTGSLGNTAVTVNSQGTLNLNSTNAFTQNVVFANNGAVNVNAVDAVSETAGLAVSGSGAITVSAAQSYTGETYIYGGYFVPANYAPGTSVIAMGITPNFIISGAGSLGNTEVLVSTDDSSPYVNGYTGYLALETSNAITQNTLRIDGGIVVQGTVTVNNTNPPVGGLPAPTATIDYVSNAISGSTTVYVNESPGGNWGTYGEAFFGSGNTYTGTTTLDGSNSNITLNITQLANGGQASSIGESSNAASNLIFSGGILQATNLTSAQSTDRLFTIGDTNSNGNTSTSGSAILDSSSSNPAYTLSFTNTGAIASGLMNYAPGSLYAAAPGLILQGSNTGNNVFAPYLSDLYNPNYNQATSLTKDGTGNWILTNENSFSGSTTINGGTLELGNANAIHNSVVVLNSNNGLTFAAPGTYNVGATPGVFNIGALTGSGNEALVDTAGNGVTLQIGLLAPAQYNAYLTYTYTGVLSGAGGISMLAPDSNQGAATQVLTSSNTYTGATTVLNGVLEGTANGASNTPFGTGGVTMNGGTLAFTPASGGTDVVDTIASGAVGTQFTYAGGGVISLNKGSDTSLTVLAGNAGETGSVLNRSGSGVLIIQTASADLGSGENFKVTGVAPTVTNGMVSASIVGLGSTNANEGDFLTYNSAQGFVSAASSYNSISGTVGAGMTGAAQITSINGNTEFTGDNSTYALVIQGNGTQVQLDTGVTINVGDGTTADPAGVILNGNVNLYGGTFNFGASEGIIYSFGGNGTNNNFGAQITGTGGVTLASGTQGSFSNFNSTNTFSGGLTIDANTTYYYNGGSYYNQFGNGQFGDPNNVVTLNGGIISGNGTYEGIGRSFVLGAAGGTLEGQMNDVANISGTGVLNIGPVANYGTSPSAYGNALVVLSGNNTNSGGIYLSSGYAVVSSEANLGAASSTITFANGFLSVMGTELTNLGSHTVLFAPDNSATIDIQNANNTFTLTQSMDQSTGGFNKLGQGTLVLTGASTYAGTTGLYGGTLVVDASQGGSLNPNTALFFDGGAIEVLGNTTGATVQNFGNVTMGINRNTSDATTSGGTIIVDSNTGDGTQSTTVNLGTLPTGSGIISGSTLGIVEEGNGTTTITTTTAPDGTTGPGEGNGIYGGRIVITINGVTDWATSNSPEGGPYVLTAYANYEAYSTDAAGSAETTDNAILTKGYTQTVADGDTTVNSLKIANTITGVGTFNLGGNSLTLTSGGLLFTGTASYTISNGTLMSGLVGTIQNSSSGTESTPGDDLIIQQYGTGSLTISAVIADGPDGSSTLTKAGPGTLYLTGANTYTGQTFVNGGVLSIASANAISSFRLNLNGGTFQFTGTSGAESMSLSQVYLGANGGGLDAASGTTLSVAGFNIFSTGSGSVGSAAITINGISGNNGGVVALTKDMGNIFGGITIDGGTLRLATGNSGDTSVLGSSAAEYLSWGAGSNGTLQLNGDNALVAGLSAASTGAVVENGNGSNSNSMIGVANGDDETFAGTLINNTGVGTDTGTGTLGFLKMGAGTLSLTNTGSSYTGKTELDGGLVNVANLADGGEDSSLGAATNLAANWAFGGGGVQYTGSTAQSTDRLFTLGDVGNALYSGDIGGNDGTIDASGSSPDATVTFSNTAAIAFANVGVHNLDLTGTNTGANTFNPILGDSTSPTSLTKSGTGTWAITAENTYSGGTTISGGQLYVDNANNLGSGTGTGAVNVTSGGTLSGTGTIAPLTGNGVVLNAGGNIAPGGVQPTVPYSGIPGTQAVGNLTLDPTGHPGGTILSATNATLTFALGAGGPATGENSSGSNIIIAGSAANIVNFTHTNNVVVINDLVGANLNLYQEYTLIQGNVNTDYEGLTLGSDVVGMGQLITGGLSLLSDPGNFFSDYYGGSELFLNGNNIDVELVPEPSTWALMIGGVVLLVFYQRRRSKIS